MKIERGEKRVIKFSLIFCFFLICSLSLVKFYPVTSDEGQITAPAINVLRGGVIYKDFFSLLPPGSIYLVAGLSKLFGVKRILLYILTSITFAIIVTAIFFLSEEKFGNSILKYAPASLTFIPVCITWYEVSHHWLSTASGLLAFIFTLSYLKRNIIRNIFISGLFYGVTILFFHSKGFLLFLAPVFLIAIKHYLYNEEEKKQKLLLEYLLLFSGAFLPLLPFLIYLGLNNALNNMFYDLFTWVIKVYYPFNKYPYYFYYGFYQLKSLFQSYPWYLAIYHSLVFLLAGLVPLIALFIYLIKIIFLFNKDRKELLIDLHYFFSSFMFFISSLYRSDVPHLYFNIPLLLILFFDGISFLAERALTALNYKKMLLSTIGIMTIFYSLQLYFQYLRLPSFKVITPTGIKYMGNNYIANRWQEIFDYLNNQNLKDGDIFTYPHSESLYYIFNLKPPTSYDFLLPGWNTNEQLLDAIQQLNKTKPRFVVMDNLLKKIVQNKWEASYPLADIDVLVNDPVSKYIQENYEVVNDYGFLLILKLKGHK